MGCRAGLHGHAGQFLAGGHIADRANILAHEGARFVHFFFVQPFDNGPVTHPETQNQPAVRGIVNRNGRLRTQRGMAQIDIRNPGADLNPRGGLGHDLAVYQRVVHEFR